MLDRHFASFDPFGYESTFDFGALTLVTLLIISWMDKCFHSINCLCRFDLQSYLLVSRAIIVVLSLLFCVTSSVLIVATV